MYLKLPKDWKNSDILELGVYYYKSHILSIWTYDIAKPKDIVLILLKKRLSSLLLEGIKVSFLCK